MKRIREFWPLSFALWFILFVVAVLYPDLNDESFLMLAIPAAVLGAVLQIAKMTGKSALIFSPIILAFTAGFISLFLYGGYEVIFAFILYVGPLLVLQVIVLIARAAEKLGCKILSSRH